mmetsp:Transcript_21793/g.28216  ORF Transcript_21793/g.28216 Transcript_21793/m.28216 type:complete len:852 (+) Transcript_21793:138-2693(+)
MGGGASSNKNKEYANNKNFEELKKDVEKDKQNGLSNEQIFQKHADPSPRDKAHRHSTQDTSANNESGPSRQKKMSESNMDKNSHDFQNERGHERRQQIFSKGIDVKKAASDVPKETMNKQNRDLLRGYLVNALRTFFFMDDGVSNRVEIILDTMKCERLPTEQFLMRQGEDGDTMYIIQSGTLEVLIDDKLVRIINEGDTVGELALLYNAPRSASVRATTPCTLWSVKRDTFREVQALATSATLVQRVAWLKSLPVLQLMDAMDICKLAGAFKTQILRDGEVLLTEGTPTDRCYLIESGAVKVTCSEEDLDRDKLAERAGGVQCTTKGNVVVGKSPKKKKGQGKDEKDGQKEVKPNDMGSPGRESSLMRENFSPRTLDPSESDASRCLYFEGSFIGTGVLLSAASIGKESVEAGAWPADQPADEELKSAQQSTASLHTVFWGAIPPVTIRAKGEARCSYFTIQGFEAMLGSIRQIISEEDGPMQRMNSDLPLNPHTGEAMKFSTDNFEDIRFLGTGSFGRVTLVVFKKEKGQSKRREMDGHKTFALKGLKKQAITERGQLAHVKDERKLLLILRHPFILRLFCTFQDQDSVYLLTEALTGGELWSVIYEGLSGHPVDGVPMEHARFYSAIVIEALGYMHMKGVAYRDLKPENIMVDSQGYLRLIDLGFAKKIPFVVEVSGEIQVHPKSYTMCGTPEYLAPEFIFNTGHDHSADYWAFGVLVFELIAGHTPFAPPGAEADMTQLFTSIACVKRDGIQFPSNFDSKAKGTRCRDLVVKLLHPEPSQRLGNLAAKTEDIKQHPYFEEIDWRRLYMKEIPGVWIPPNEVPTSESNADPGMQHSRYTGDQAVFAEF